MAYDPALALARDRVRFVVGDTDDNNVLVPDATYNYWLDTAGLTERQAVATIARYLISRYSQEPTRVSLPDGTTADFSERINGWTAIVNDPPDTTGETSGGKRITRLARPQLINGGSEYS
jgi:hypothetical protein